MLLRILNSTTDLLLLANCLLFRGPRNAMAWLNLHIFIEAFRQANPTLSLLLLQNLPLDSFNDLRPVHTPSTLCHILILEATSGHRQDRPPICLSFIDGVLAKDIGEFYTVFNPLHDRFALRVRRRLGHWLRRDGVVLNELALVERQDYPLLIV